MNDEWVLLMMDVRDGDKEENEFVIGLLSVFMVLVKVNM